MNVKKRFWTENEAAVLCGVPYWKLKYLRDTGRITPMKIGRALAYSETDVKIAMVLVADRNGIRKKGNQFNKGEVQ